MSFDMTLTLNFNSVSEESAEKFAQDLAQYLRVLYRDALSVEQVNVQPRAEELEEVATR
jgi:hypothetical protein